MSSEGELTALLVRCRAGDRDAHDRLAEVVYRPLRRLAGRRLAASGPGQALATTELVHETYLKLLGQRRIDWRNRAQFFAIAARLMRRVLLEAARFHGRAKRGGGRRPATLDRFEVAVDDVSVDALALDQALARLERIDARAARVVELRFFAGMTTDEIAATLGSGRATVTRSWRFARSFLRLQLSTERVSGEGADGA